MIGLENLPPEISSDLAKMKRKPWSVMNPSPDVWGEGMHDELVRVMYLCPHDCNGDNTAHTHHALYGPRFDDPAKFTLYAD